MGRFRCQATASLPEPLMGRVCNGAAFAVSDAGAGLLYCVAPGFLASTELEESAGGTRVSVRPK
jgi:hypothetical protein